MKKNLALVVMLGMAMSFNSFASDEVASLNATLKQLFTAMVKDNKTAIQVNFSSLDVNAAGVKSVGGTINYLKYGSKNMLGFAGDISYSNPQDGTSPVTSIKLMGAADILKIAGPDAFKDVDAEMKDLVDSMSKQDVIEAFKDAIDVSAAVENKQYDAKGNLLAADLNISMKIHMDKIPAGTDISEIPIESATLTANVSPMGASVSLNIVSNLKYSAFQQDNDGLKEWLESLLKQDPKSIQLIGMAMGFLDMYASKLVDAPAVEVDLPSDDVGTVSPTAPEAQPQE
ncbi:hypothetical protein K2X30_02075 [bacterium]|jgi:hypothetical protein|nr:hypothetical protein [bacterium]